MITLVIRIFNALTGYRFWYRIRQQYIDKHGTRTFNITSDIGLYDREDICNHRKLKCAIGPIHTMLNHNKSKQDLHNGTIKLEPTCYLGHFKYKKSKK